ncbi:AMP-binding protein [Chitinophaga nivalis]|uniref:AMP-binding protein n=1 Tax=Chitinophaga nivalis TaxID=2991709 RepID=A0ABT3IJ05_9BACT|nr:AMP-binding protein [Chitinophaga nivalis]MCW3466349.1 AMP-binding protein [Chitinophaga nivalis]MCW3483960.1 AMP-binding protein [Chitinophaga nivalis]
MERASKISSYLQRGAHLFPQKTAYCYLEDGDQQEVRCTYADLYTQVQTLAAQLREQGLTGHPAMLLYPEGMAFIIAFLACQEAGVIAVPMFPPRGNRHMERLYHILTDAGTHIILCAGSIAGKIRSGLEAAGPGAPLHIIVTDDPAVTAPVTALLSPAPEQDIAFIQYTSGSTGAPKGVVISHANLLHNELLLTATFGADADSVICSWLPFYHDMGLIGNILHSIYVGGTCILMSPFHFMQQPLRWLKAIDKYQVTHSGGPNFSFDICVDKIAAEEVARLNLSSWKVAYNGAEPVKKTTMDRFAAWFAPAGFDSAVFFPCYGLAEATLLVSGVKTVPEVRTVGVDRAALNAGFFRPAATTDQQTIFLVSSGKVAPGMQVKILPPENGGEDQIGEIAIAGTSVSRGYWSEQHDLAAPAENSYRRTGDLGFLYEGQLFVTGRKKEILIIRGKNYYPYDIENACSAAHPAIEKNAVAAIAVPVGEEEQLILIAEVKRTLIREIDPEVVARALMQAVIEETGLSPYDVVLVGPLSIPRTSSGKLQRNKCSILYRENGFNTVATIRTAGTPAATAAVISPELISQVRTEKDPVLILQYLELLFRYRLQHTEANLRPADELTAVGVDSLRAMELVNTINKDLGIHLDASRIFQANTIGGLITIIETTLWISDAKPSGQEILL